MTASPEDGELPKIGAPATRALQGAGYPTLRSLDGMSRRDLLAPHGMGPKAAGLLEAEMQKQGFKLR